MAASGHVTGWTGPALIFVVFTLSLQLLPGLSDLLRFSRPAFEAGAWWQPVTSQWIHLSMLHAIVNAAAMVLMLLAFDQLAGWRTQVISLLGGYLGAAIVIAMDSDCTSYAGASGALHGFFAGTVMYLAADHTLRRSSRALALIALMLMGVKLVFTYITGLANLHAVGWLGFPTYYPAHEAGVAGGLVTALLATVLLRIGKRSAKNHAGQRKP